MTVPTAGPKISTTADVNATRKKILVVDDDPVIVQALSLKLKSEGYAVVTAADGSEALCATRLEKPDLMLLDVNFPPDVAHGGTVPWNGFLLTQWLRRLEIAKNTTVILISATDRTEYKQRASDVGAAAFLPKPLDHNLLLASIQTALSGRRDGGIGSIENQRLGPENQVPADRFSQPQAPAFPENSRTNNPTLEFGL